MNDHRRDGFRLADLVGKIGVHDHLCIIYETQDEQLSAAIPFLKIGLERGEKCVYIADANTAATLTNAMRDGGINVDNAVKRGSLTITNKEIYPFQRDFDPNQWIKLIEDLASGAKSAGFSALRLAAEMTWVTGTDPRPERLIEFEAKINHLTRDRDLLGICQYDQRLFRPELILNVLRTHPTVVYRGCVCENPYYVPPEEFLSPRSPEREIERMLARMREDTANRERLRQSEERIRKASEQYEKETRALIDTIPQQIWSGPADGSIDFANERWRSYTGLSLEELQGQGWQSMLHPDDRERVIKAWRESVANGTPYEQEERHRGADGTYRWFLSRGVPMRDAEGRIVRWYGTNTDIEDRKRAEEALHRSEAYLAEAQKLSHTGSWAFDTVHRAPIYWSQEWYRISGLNPADGLSIEKARALHTPEEWSRLMEVVDRAVKEKVDYQTDTQLVFPDGSTKDIHIVGHPVVNASGEVVELLGTVMDVTDRKRAEEQLRRLSSQLLRLHDEERRSIARDLHDTTGQDLVALSAMLSQLRDSLPASNRKSREVAAQCQALAERCVREIRTLSYVLYPPMLDKTGLEDAIQHYLQGFAERTKIDVKLNTSPQFGRVSREIELALFRVIQESLTNIHRHSGSSTAEIRLVRDAEKILLEVIDSGRGILSPQDQPGSMKEGVGIPSMRERVKRIGGVLQIEPTERGTVVRVTVPVDE